ncbi:uncharacterized protein LOC109122696 [Vitis vinifera]|uniref:uncharacterized protein LOC109122696 n=1 Tax=Vitis vinifera TaxID=29760 RepID=UPI00288317E4|nr:uncharacterized protein LOC109122696 [Vitis vinifera]
MTLPLTGCYGLGLNWWQSSYGGPRALHFLGMLRFALSTSLSLSPNQQLQNDAVFYRSRKEADRKLPLDKPLAAPLEDYWKDSLLALELPQLPILSLQVSFTLIY